METGEEEAKALDSPSKIPEDEIPKVTGETDFDYPAKEHAPACEDPKQFIWSEEKAMFPESFVRSDAKYD